VTVLDPSRESEETVCRAESQRFWQTGLPRLLRRMHGCCPETGAGMKYLRDPRQSSLGRKTLLQKRLCQQRRRSLGRKQGDQLHLQTQTQRQLRCDVPRQRQNPPSDVLSWNPRLEVRWLPGDQRAPRKPRLAASRYRSVEALSTAVSYLSSARAEEAALRAPAADAGLPQQSPLGSQRTAAQLQH